MEPVKLRKSRAQRRKEKLLATARKQCEEPAQLSQPLDFHIPSDMVALQQADPTLKPWIDKVSEVECVNQGKTGCLAYTSYVIKKGIIYQCQGKVLALPQSLTVGSLYSLGWPPSIPKIPQQDW